MKTTLLLIFTLFIAIDLSAQSHRFADTTAQWSVNYFRENWPPMNPSTNTVSIYEVKGDTMINGKMYQSIEGNYLRRDQDAVYLLEYTGAEVKIYEFGHAKGDTIRDIDVLGRGKVHCIVDSVETLNLPYARQKMWVTLYDSTNYHWLYWDEWVEGIGSLRYNPIHPFIHDLYLDHDGEYLVCYMENGVRYYGTEAACLEGTSIGEVNSISASVYPNPSSDAVTFTLSAHPSSSTHLHIHDAVGHLVTHTELKSTTQQISIADLPDGMYTYTITQNNLRQASGKLVIAK